MKKIVWLGVFACVSFLSCTTVPEKVREPNSLLSGMDLATPADFDRISSTKNLKLRDAEILTDNDDAFEEKLKIIRSARAGETIRLVYYIYSHDYSSSVMTQELLSAAQRGVKVKLLLDFFINYGSLDELLLMQQKSQGNIQIRFYGKPTDLMIRDARFLTMPCPTKTPQSKAYDCSKAKWQQIAATKNPDIYARLLLSAIYTRNFELLKIAIMGGQEIDLATFKISHNWQADNTRDIAADVDLESIFKNLKLLKDAKIDGEFIARLKISLGLALMGKKLNPLLYEVFGRIPLDQPQPYSWRDWLHFTDYTHHKFLMVEDRKFILGGRNIEDSYHMKKNPLTSKYIFRDVDMVAEVQSGGQDLVMAYDRLWNYQPLVWTAKEAHTFLPHDWATESEWLTRAAALCQQHVGKSRTKLKSCLEGQVKKSSMVSLAGRQEKVAETWKNNAAIYEQQYVRRGAEPRFHLSSKELSQVSAYYLENLPFSLADKKSSSQDRIYGASKRSLLPWGLDREELNGKNIHAAWMKELENTCEASRLSGKPARVIFHNAYYLPPANLIRAFGKMIDGRWNCKNVTVTLVTNSDQSTDLFFINILARYQLKAMFETYRRKGAGSKAAKFEFLEYKGADDTGGRISLHTKVSVFGDNVLVGSANFDVRSFYMDTNNGLLVRQAPELADKYIRWIDDLRTNSGLLVDRTRTLQGFVPLEKMQDEDWKLAQSYIRKLAPDFADGKNGEFLRSLINKVSKRIYQLSLQMVDVNYVETNENDNNVEALQRSLETEYDELLQLL